MRAPLGGPSAVVGRTGSGPNYVNEIDLLRQANNLGAGNVVFNSGGLAISAGGATTAKTANTIDYVVKGVLATKATTTLPALAGTITNANFGGWVFTINVAGTFASRFMTQGATVAAITWPVIPDTETVVGYVRLNPTTADFVGGTTLLDAANTNAIYINTPFGLGFLVTPLP